jgi:predicted patatin/cPLA2 family phospholipase
MEKYVIYFAGGTMTGVFGAGAATAFLRADLYHKISAVYGASAGVMTGAYFLARQADLGSSIYLEDLDRRFIKSKKNFFIGVWQRFQNRFIKEVNSRHMRDALDVEYAMDIIKNKKKLDVSKIISSDIPLNIKFFNLDSHEIEYIDARRADIFEILEAGIKVFPYMHDVSNIDGKRLIDGAIMDILGTNLLKKRHPSEKIIIVMNNQTNRKLRYHVKNILEGKWMEWMFCDSELYKIHATAEDKLIKDLEIIKQDPNIYLISPNKDMSVKSRTTDKKALLQMYNLGIKMGEQALQDFVQ